MKVQKILILGIILRKLQNSKKNSENKKILRIRIPMNTSPDIGYKFWLEISQNVCMLQIHVKLYTFAFILVNNKYIACYYNLYLYPCTVCKLL